MSGFMQVLIGILVAGTAFMCIHMYFYVVAIHEKRRKLLAKRTQTQEDSKLRG